MSWIFRIFMAWPRLHNFYQRPYRCINEATRMNLHFFFFCSLSFLSVSLFLSSRQSARNLSLSSRLCFIHIGSVQSGTLRCHNNDSCSPNGTKSIKPMCHCSPLTYSLPKGNEKVREKRRKILMLRCSVLTTELWAKMFRVWMLTISFTFYFIGNLLHWIMFVDFRALENVFRKNDAFYSFCRFDVLSTVCSTDISRLHILLSISSFWPFGYFCVRPLLLQRAPFRIYDFVQKKWGTKSQYFTCPWSRAKWIINK